MAARLVFTRSFHASSLALSAQAKSALELSLREGLKSAMKAKDKPATSCLKAVLADITNAGKAQADPSAPLPEASVLTTLRKSLHSRSQAAEQYAPGQASAHPENHADLLREVELLSAYLPKAPSSETIEAALKSVIDTLTPDERTNRGVQGTIMKSLLTKLGEAAASVDRKELGKLVSEALKK